MQYLIDAVKKEWPWLLLLIVSAAMVAFGASMLLPEVVSSEEMVHPPQMEAINNAQMTALDITEPIPVYKPGTDEIDYYLIQADALPFGCMSASENPD
jgi:LPS O-antigen subunit length determinant protein (WzzB/FepE family)